MLGTPMNTNMYSEWFHGVLKILYLQHQQKWRVDFYTLLKIARDKAIDQLQKCKHTYRICDMNKRHKTALTYASLAGIKETESNVYKVTSQSRPNSKNKHIMFLQTKMQILFCMCIYVYVHLIYQIQPLQMKNNIINITRFSHMDKKLSVMY